ncbi:hypothetical protein [Parapusillimonas granuli]|uniref:Uncharacterized protein n=1 Tax=Parapusillimonas granuli TaxID=380911 RepID=A0A853FWH1_9BURK|nr:hypothetical protein [Parapusillimonas granuli]MBB5213934.1 hypothetical protein [Parapusillimonas granuli]NYT50355.1 hypothetical protein [Parapusillimonas granuli]
MTATNRPVPNVTSAACEAWANPQVLPPRDAEAPGCIILIYRSTIQVKAILSVLESGTVQVQDAVIAMDQTFVIAMDQTFVIAEVLVSMCGCNKKLIRLRGFFYFSL